MADEKAPDPPGMDINFGVDWEALYGEGSKIELDHMHSQWGLCDTNIKRIISPFHLSIRACETDGPDISGLWTHDDIEPGCDIYRVCPLMAVPLQTAEYFCHYCLESSQDFAAQKKQPPKACAGCKVARFCSKVTSPKKT